MSFFEPPQPLPAQPEHRPPAWSGPPANVIGAAVPIHLVVARTATVALSITGITAYPTGTEFLVALRVRDLTGESRRFLMHGSPFHYHHVPGQAAGEPIPRELLRLGVQFADGRKATTLDRPPWRPDQEPAERAVLVPRGGGGGGNAWDMRFWLWPLPPPGPLLLVAEWPLGEIPLTKVELDAAAILDASAKAELLWPEHDEPSPAGGWSSQVIAATRDEAAPVPDDLR